MTLKNLIDSIPSENGTYLINVNGNFVWDYKNDHYNNLYLISENLFTDDTLEKVTLNELINYALINGVFERTCSLYSEHSGIQLTKYEWKEEVLYLSY